MEKERSIITISTSTKFEADNSRFNDKCTLFDIFWYLVTATASIIKFTYSSQEDIIEVILFISLFALPICIKHIFAFDIYKDIRASDTGTKVFNFVNNVMNWLFVLSTFILLLMALLATVVSYNQKVQLLMFLVHVVMASIGIYDRITVKINPKFENEENGGDSDD